MHSIARNRAHARPRRRHRRIVLWFVVYAAFMLALIAFNGSTQLFDHHMLAWPAFPGSARSPPALVRLGRLFALRRRLGKGLETLQAALVIGPDDAVDRRAR